MKYIFLTNTIGGCSGGATYVRNKLVWLKNNGWEVDVYDSGGQMREDVLLSELLPYRQNHIYEFYYHPNDFTRKRREKIINKILLKCNLENEIVFESNTINLAEWGELIASRTKAKHLVYLIQENLVLYRHDQFDFLKFKSKKDELFSINPQAYTMLFSRFEEVNNPENHYWQAGNASQIVDIDCEKINSLPKADITISHFGRKKDYFDYMISEVCLFAGKHLDKHINLVLLGIDTFKWREELIVKNLKIFPLGNINPIPSSFYKISDVVIATAGCASMSFRYGAKVISMDTFKAEPLGVMGYTTLDRTYRSKDNNNHQQLSELLDEVLIKKKFKNEPMMSLPKSGKTYDYQISFINNKTTSYYDTTVIGLPQSFIEFRDFVFLKMGLVKIRTIMRWLSFRSSK